MNYSICNQFAIPEPQIESPYCAVSAIGNLTSVLKLCCQDGPIANYSSAPNIPTYCFQYCDITNPELSYESVQSCISYQIVLYNATQSSYGHDTVCGPGLNTTSSAPTLRTRKLAWAALGIALMCAVV